MEPSQKYLISIELQTSEKVWNRSVVSHTIPSSEDLYFYYERLCGFEHCTIEVHSEPVPDDFNDSFLATLNCTPTNFPINDLETSADNTEKRDQYKQYLQQLCKMEHTRSKLQVFGSAKVVEEEAQELGKRPKEYELKKKRAWIQDLLRALNEEYEYDEIVPAGAQDQSVPIAWIISPTAQRIRETQGSRFILDPTLGKYWEERLGTDMFPDFVVGRRLSTATWACQHPTSNSLLQSTLDWYLTSQDAKIEGGVSSWVMEADKEFNILLSAFRRIKVHEKFLQVDEHSQSRVFTILSILESRYLASSSEEETIHPIGVDVFQKYVNYIFLALKVPKEQYWGLESIRMILVRWTRSGLGFRAGVDSYVDQWKETWKLVIRGDATPERVSFFLQTLDMWDSIESVLYTNQQRVKMVREWVNIFLHTQVIRDPTASIRSAIVHDTITKWCFKFLPEKLFQTNITPNLIGPVMTQNGFITTKKPGGRWVAGFVLANAPTEFTDFSSIPEEVHEKMEKPEPEPVQNVVVANAKKSKKKMVQVQVPMEQTIEHLIDIGNV